MNMVKELEKYVKELSDRKHERKAKTFYLRGEVVEKLKQLERKANEGRKKRFIAMSDIIEYLIENAEKLFEKK